MKYEKPMAAVEFYSLSQSIAACTIRISYVDTDCVVRDPDTPTQTRSLAYIEKYFTDVCVKNALAMNGNDSICYHTQVNAMFTS